MKQNDCFNKVREMLPGLKEMPEFVEQIKMAENKQQVVDDLKAAAMRRKKLTQMQKVKHEELKAKILSHPKGIVSGLRSLLTNDVYGVAGYSNIEYRTSAIIGQSQSMFADVIQQLSTTKFGFGRQNKNLADDMILELFGTDTGSAAAKKLAKQWTDASESIRTRFNDAGGTIGKIDNWGLPQTHSQSKIHKAGADAWVNKVRPLLKNGDELDLYKIYETIVTGGVNKLHSPDPTKAKLGGGKMLANKHTDPRTLNFKDGESWLAYTKEFGGTDDPLAVMMDHIRVMATDTANVEILGVNPDAMFKTLAEEVKYQQAMVKGTQGGHAGYTEALYAVVSGKVDESAAQSTATRGMEAAFGTLRAIQTATKLGSAVLSAVSDIGTLMVATKYNGMSITKVLVAMIKNFNLDNQVEAGRLGLGLDVFNSTITQRFSEMGSGVSSKVAEGVMRASGMNIWTEAARKAFQTEFYQHLKTKPDKLFKRYGWTQKEIDDIDFNNMTLEENTRILEMVNEESDYAVMMPTARTRAMTTGGAKRGTISGESIRTGMQFKSFPATFMIQQMGRTFMQGSVGSRFAYGGGIFLSTTILGALAVVAKDAAKGYAPRDGSPLSENLDYEDQTKFWLAAAVQGGGAGIVGDLLFSDRNRFGGSITSTIAGPSMGTVERGVKLTVGNIQQALAGEDTNFGSEAVEFVNREANPLNLWYSKAALEYFVTEDLKKLLDEDYDKAARKRERKRRRKEYGLVKFEELEDSFWDN